MRLANAKMRGLLSLFSTEHDLRRYCTGVFIASAEDDVITKVLPILPNQFPQVSFTFITPQAYAGLFSSPGETLWTEEIKSKPLRWLASLRKRKFDLCIVLLAGRPTYRKTKLAALLLNARRTVAYDQNGDSFELDRAHWKVLLTRMGCWKVLSRNERSKKKWPSVAGVCNICGATGQFADRTHGTNPRETLNCPRCGSSSRDRKLIHVLGLALGQKPPLRDWPVNRNFRIFETGGYRGHPTFLEKKFDYYNTKYDPEKIAAGADSRRWADVQKLPYAPDFFDCILSSDVFEHVRLDDRGFRELFRVLKPGGTFVLQAPYDHEVKTHVLVQPDGDEDHFLEPPQYHAEHTLVYRIYGYDLLDRLQQYGFSVSRLYMAVPKYVISVQNTFLLRKDSYVQLISG
jgi:Methyltransferase domain